MTPPLVPDLTDPGFESTEMDRIDLRNMRHFNRRIENGGFAAATVIGFAWAMIILGRLAGLLPKAQAATLLEVIALLGIMAFLTSPKIFARATAGGIWGKMPPWLGGPPAAPEG